ncbi:LOW QUALITY PROTEIN: hypothetical protein MC885_017168 [Smutsia gigantea]|nr:LOW QUALITY PROTEIN: hypothetical protein MC885_017168 [Smutsia gigantea]
MVVLERLKVRNVGRSIFVFFGDMELEEATIISQKQKGTSQVPGLSRVLQVLKCEETQHRHRGRGADKERWRSCADSGTDYIYGEMATWLVCLHSPVVSLTGLSIPVLSWREHR